jgi:hypothetical protein
VVARTRCFAAGSIARDLEATQERPKRMTKQEYVALPETIAFRKLRHELGRSLAHVWGEIAFRSPGVARISFVFQGLVTSSPRIS